MSGAIAGPPDQLDRTCGHSWVAWAQSPPSRACGPRIAAVRNPRRLAREASATAPYSLTYCRLQYMFCGTLWCISLSFKAVEAGKEDTDGCRYSY